MAFEAVAGQEEAVALLRRALAGQRVAHAYAFVGPPGVGRRAAALELAKALVAPGGGRDASRVERGAHPDVAVLAPAPPAGNPKGPLALRIEDVRDLERRAALRPAEAAWKVFVVDDADRMTAQAAQAFLKTLEEPPARTVIVLILAHVAALPPTVVSRCQVVRFAPRVVEGALALLPPAAAPGREDALRCLREAERSGAEAILAGGEAVGRDRQAAETIVETCWLWYRDLLCAQAGGPPRLAVFGAEGAARLEGARALSLDQVLAGLRACREAWQAIQGNVSPRLTVEVLLGRLARGAAEA